MDITKLGTMGYVKAGEDENSVIYSNFHSTSPNKKNTDSGFIFQYNKVSGTEMGCIYATKEILESIINGPQPITEKEPALGLSPEEIKEVINAHAIKKHDTKDDELNEAYDTGYQSCLNYNKGLSWTEAEELQHYRQLKDQGKLIELPCKEGDLIFRVFYVKGRPGVISATNFTLKYYSDNKDKFGKTIFLTHEAAELALKKIERESNNPEKCLFCKSKKCYSRIVSTDDNGNTYDEVACRKHEKELEKHSDETAPGVMKLFISSTGTLKRGDSIEDKMDELKKYSKEKEL